VRIADITRQIACAITTAARHIAGPVALTGHSAGGHLVARMGVQGVLPSHVAQRLHSIVPISPVADLRPLLKTSMNAQLGLDMAAAKAESPVLMTPRDVPVSIWVGGDERPAFLDQARWLAEAWRCDHVEADGKHHFDVIDALADPDSAMVAALLG
jgi:acetyl esterase/lipase